MEAENAPGEAKRILIWSTHDKLYSSQTNNQDLMSRAVCRLIGRLSYTLNMAFRGSFWKRILYWTTGILCVQDRYYRLGSDCCNRKWTHVRHVESKETLGLVRKQNLRKTWVLHEQFYSAVLGTRIRIIMVANYLVDSQIYVGLYQRQTLLIVKNKATWITYLFLSNS